MLLSVVSNLAPFRKTQATTFIVVWRILKLSIISIVTLAIIHSPQGSTRLKSKAEAVTHELKDDTLVNRLKACLALQNVYRDTLRTVRDSLGTSQNLSHFTSMSSINVPPSSLGGK